MRRLAVLTVVVSALLVAGAGPGADGQHRPARRPVPASREQPSVQGEAAARLEAPQPGARSPRNASYAIDVQLLPAARMLKGHETLTWRNITPNPTSELRFHLYYNAWRNTRSTWMREALTSGRRGGGGMPAEGDWSWIDISAIRLVGAGAEPPIDLAGRQRFVAPDDGNADDRTVLVVPLPSPVAPGQTINVDLEWTSKIPRTFARTGAIGHFFFIAQWFPKVGVLEATGWNCHQFHAGTEFFSDYGTYDVRITVPRGWVVGATGVERGRTDSGAETRHRYVEQDVHDFAWTTSPDYLERKARFAEPGLAPVDMRLLLQPEHEGQAERHFAATRTALKYYGRWFGAYPYGHVTIVDPAWQSGAGGMEYPTLFTAGTRWLAPKDVDQPEAVTIHECGHQFWYGIVGNNEFEHAWMDEGFNTYSTARAEWQVYNPNYAAQRYFGGFVPWVFRDIPRSREIDGDGLAAYRAAAESDIPATPSFLYWPATGAAISYDKTALWLGTLERYLGWTTLQKIMSTYFERWQFRHPRPEDFFQVVNEVSGRDMKWFFDQVYRSSNEFDYGIQEFRSAKPAEAGFFDRNGARAFSADHPGAQYRTDVVVRRYGEAIFPVDVLVTFRNGEKVREQWGGVERWKRFTYTRPEQAVSAVVDPDRVLLLDVNYTNNSRTLEPDTGPATTKWMFKWMAWLEDALMTYAWFV